MQPVSEKKEISNITGFNYNGAESGWEDQQNKGNNSEEDNLYESIEEEIVVSQHDSPLITKHKAKNIGMPPLAPKVQQQSVSTNKLKVETMSNFNQIEKNDHEPIDEEINQDLNTDADLY